MTCRFALPLLLTALTANAAAPVQHVHVVATFPHSTASFTEGFFYRNGLFYEGTGLVGQSFVLAYEPVSGKVIKKWMVPPGYFGEGIIDWRHHILEWTWQTHLGFVLDAESFQSVSQFHYEGEGWGITRTVKELITSNGTEQLTFRDPESFKPVRQITVTDEGRPIQQLNELEYIHGEIWANIWQTDRIARISPADGHVIGWIDLTGLLPDNQRIGSDAVLNGIAYDAARDRIFVTGKQWPKIFQIRLVP